MKLPKCINNKYVLYLVLVLAIINVLCILSAQDFDSLTLFVISGLLSSYFSKNMIINLIVAMIVANTSFFKNVLREGMEDKKSKKNKKCFKKNKKGTWKQALDDEGNPFDEDSCGKSMCWAEKNDMCGNGKKEGMGQKNVPSSKPARVNDDDDEVEVDRIDYAATLESAYDNLQNMLGTEGVKGLTSETKRLVDQQKSLMESLNNMAPVLNTAKKTLDGLELPDMKGLQDMMGKLKGGGGKKKE